MLLYFIYSLRVNSFRIFRNIFISNPINLGAIKVV